MADEECQRQCKQMNGEHICQERNCELGGPVMALASTGASLFAAGVFQVAGGHPVKNLAQYFGGIWKPVLGGVIGSIFDLKVFSLTPPSSYFESGVQDFECLYVAGDLESVINEDGTAQLLQGLARVCLEVDLGPGSGKWEGIVGMEGLGPVLAVHVAGTV